MVMPEMVMDLLTPTFLSLYTPAIAEVFNAMGSLFSIPANAAFVVTRFAVAEVEPLYARDVAVMPVTVSVLAAISAVVVGCVIE